MTKNSTTTGRGPRGSPDRVPQRPLRPRARHRADRPRAGPAEAQAAAVQAPLVRSSRSEEGEEEEEGVFLFWEVFLFRGPLLLTSSHFKNSKTHSNQKQGRGALHALEGGRERERERKKERV